MTTSRMVMIVMVNIGFNVGLIWLLYRWQVHRRRKAYRDLCRDSWLVCQQVRQLNEDWSRKEGVLS